MRKSRLLLVLFLIVLGTIGWELASPWWTLKNMRDAARARDSDRLAGYVDFPRVRSDLREQIIEQVGARGPASGYDAFVRRFGARPIIDPIINFIVSPEALRVALLVAPPAGDSGTSDDSSRKACGVERDGLQQFRLRCVRLPNGHADFVFERRGLGWVLVGIDLPADYGAVVP